MEIPLRVARVDDIPALKLLINRSVRELSKGYYTEAEIESALIYVFGVDSQLITDGTYYVAEIDDQIVGCGGWSKRKTLFGGDQMKAQVNKEDSLLDPATESSRIRAFFVDPAWARRGIASALINRCEQSAREAGFLTMELASTLPGEPLYKVFGYQPVERIDIPLPESIIFTVINMKKSITK